MIILGLVALPLVAAAKPEAKPPKIEICHSTGDGEAHVIEVSAKALEAHLAHGDIEGLCGTSDTALPDVTASFSFTIVKDECTFFLCPVLLDANTSVGSIDTYLWSASNGTNGSEAITTILLPNFDTTTVTLSVIGPDGDATTSQDVAISVLPPTTP
jgi:hypothetical protein